MEKYKEIPPPVRVEPDKPFALSSYWSAVFITIFILALLALCTYC